jgi:peptidoglycan/LPS O-acetylase OafA/YrhL
MPATGSRTLTGLEAVRGVASVAVVLYHAARHLHKNHSGATLAAFFQFGHAGVDLFFVLSGFIIMFVHFDDVGRPRRLGHYVQRRLTRLLPAYWVALGLTVALSMGGGHGLPSLGRMLSSIALLPSHQEPLLGVAWTLQYEIVFYALFCVLILDRIAGAMAVGLWLIWIALAQFGLGGSLPGSLSGIDNLEFILGAAAAIWLQRGSLAAPWPLFAIGLGLFAIAALCEDAGLLDGYADSARAVYGLPSAMIIAGLAEASRSGHVPVPALLRRLGKASYSIYLFQFVFIGLLWKCELAAGLATWLPVPVNFVLLATGAVVGGLMLSTMVEYPLMRMIRGERSKRLANAPAA